MAPETATLLVLVLLVAGTAYAVCWLVSPRGRRWRERARTRTRRATAHSEVAPTGRPIEEIAADVRRLAIRYHCLGPRASFVKADGVRRAYDGVLAECCAALEITHLLGVLAPGPELDVERTRVEGLLDDSGLRLPFAA